ncbi:RidA family protein [Natrarchaeobius oligotrophus]|uniref:RidA family protein n=1 Tax=Natrarchaeobius chitinivorans TaxID=1679083 RepID=A0A3N6MNY4_NATCH|nr:RidA family protein [Natrarchaeobius chitinivorans]RQG99230.1 RidA family protein [Natrarchaeobius chitinivorans]
MKEVSTADAPPSIGPFSQGLVDDGTVYVSGQGPIDPETGDIVGDDIEAETHRTMKNIGAVLEAAGSSLDDVVKATVFVQDMDNYDAINGVYESYLSEPYPARSAVQVEDLPVDIGVEIEVIARVSQ